MKNNKAGFKKTLSSKGFMVLISFLGLYLLSTGASWAVFSFLKSDPSLGISMEGLEKARAQIADLPKTEECPINGAMYSEPERGIWETRRPITAMIENHHESRPLEGLNRADVLYEAVSEGGITRFLAVFYCGAAASDVRIAPVRSARIYFINWAAEYGNNPLFVHVGGANNFCGDCPGGEKYAGQVAKKVRAIEELVDLGWRYAGGNDFDTTYDSGFPVFFRDPERLGREIATEHTMVSTTDSIYEQANERGFAFKDEEGNNWDENYRTWKFKDGAPSSSPKAAKISFEFWEDTLFSSDYAVRWEYDPAQNLYLRFIGGKADKDLSTETQLSASNVIVQFVEEDVSVDKEKHNYYETNGDGDAIIFQNGDAIEGTWEKKSQSDRTIFYDESGDEIEFVRGVIWIEALPNGNSVDY